MKNFKYSTQTISKKDIISVNKILKSEFLTQGPKTPEFENKIKILVGSKYVLATNSASSALLLACKVLSLKSGDLLIYEGCKLEHWREAFDGENCSQAFLHYNDLSSNKAEENKYDKRPFIGLPAFFIENNL